MLRSLAAILPLFLSFSAFAMNPDQKTVAEKLTSIWENDTTELQYGYSEDIGDDRGYTSGRAGFCTGTGDAVMVLRCFDKLTGKENPLHKYMKEMENLEKRFQENWQLIADVSGLNKIGSYPKDWEAADADRELRDAFRSCQDHIVDILYYNPAMKAARRYGLQTALSKAVIYDSFINHGESGAVEIADHAQKKSGLPPEGGHTLANEKIWLTSFLEKRKAILRADDVWEYSVGRVINYEALVKADNWQLDRAFSTLATESGYTVYKIEP